MTTLEIQRALQPFSTYVLTDDCRLPDRKLSSYCVRLRRGDGNCYVTECAKDVDAASGSPTHEPVLRVRPRGTLASQRPGDSATIRCTVLNTGTEIWPAASAIGFGVRITAVAQPWKALAESRSPLPAVGLAPGVPIEAEIVLPTGTLPIGHYYAVFDVTGPDGSWQAYPSMERANGVPFEISLNADVARELTDPASAEADRRRPLLASDVIRRDFTKAVFADSHGAFGQHLGAGLIYYTLGALVRSQVSVCIGSGGGFVPSLMRRAQIDAGCDPAITYLVDANLPDLAFGSPIQSGGWMTDGSDFLVRESDIRVLPMLSIDAAKLFASEGLRIDHLHVDGDHSCAGVLADMEAYLPLVSALGIVTFHDLRMPGVQEAISVLERRCGDLELLTFPEIGAGTGVLRRRVAPDVARRALTQADFVDSARKTRLPAATVSSAAGESQVRARFERWSYLSTPSYQLRYRLAADFVDQADHTIVEIGGFPNTIVSWIERAKTAHLIEPYAPRKFAEEINRLGGERGVTAYLHPGSVAYAAPSPRTLTPYNLVCLGLDLTSGVDGDDDWIRSFTAFVDLISNARRAVVEIPGYELSELTWKHVSLIVKPRIVTDVTLDLSRDPVANSFHVKDNRGVRRLIMMEIDAPVDTGAADVQALTRVAAEEVRANRAKMSKPQSSLYVLGTPIDFCQGGNSALFTRDGWVGPEKHHRWMSGQVSRMVMAVELPLSSAMTGASAKLVLRAKPFLASDVLTSQSLVIEINGHTVYAGKLEREGPVEALFPIALLRAEDPVEMVFRHPDAARPCDLLPNSSDRKVLSIAFSSMSITVQSNVLEGP